MDLENTLPSSEFALRPEPHADGHEEGPRSARSSHTSTISSTFDYEDDEDVRTAGNALDEIEEVSSTAMVNLRSIVTCMIPSGD